MKYCKDCKWYGRNREWYSGDVYVDDYETEIESTYYSTRLWLLGCLHPNTITTIESEVTGKHEKKIDDCPKRIRVDKTKCGPTAKWFEEKERPKPLCIDCRYYTSSIISTKDGPKFECLCHSPKRVKESFSLVTGIHDTSSVYCGVLRSFEPECGPYGNWFEKKEEIKPGAIIEFTPTKKQNWLRRLICGGKHA